jgi:ABC-type multidrug transport system fused ATPase/permease subunit
LNESRLKNSSIYRSLRLLSRKEIKKLTYVLIIQISLGLLDLIGVALIGVLGALSVSGVQSKQPGNRVSQVLNTLFLGDLAFQKQVAILGIMAATILIIKTILSVIFTRKILHFLSQRSSAITSRLLSKFFNQDLVKIQTNSSQENLYSMTVGVQSITVGLIGSAISLLSDFSMLIILFIGLFVVDAYLAISTVLLFVVIGLFLHYVMQKKANNLGLRASELTIESNTRILELIESFREISTRDRSKYYTNLISKLRQELSSVNAEMMFMPNVSKYVIETSLVIGAIAIGGVQFATQDASHAVAALSVFLAAGSRIAPGVLRIQQGLIYARSSLGAAKPTLLLIESLESFPALDETKDQFNTTHAGFDGSLKINRVSLLYPNRDVKAVDNLDLEIDSGTTLAIVGPSGAGKTSLVDLILGVIQPSEGRIVVSGYSPREAISKWPGAISYVPQNISIINDSIRQNILLGFPRNSLSDDQLLETLKFAHLDAIVQNLESGLDAVVGDKGLKISGGQRQRLGIARAVVTSPKLLVLDEATSALDAQTEFAIADSIQKMKGKVTLIIVAHRLSTVMNSDVVIYMDKGRIIAKGNFEEVRALVPDFDLQAKLMGL